MTILGRVLLRPTIFSWLGFFVFYWEKRILVVVVVVFQPAQTSVERAISYPESSGSLFSGKSPGETLGNWNRRLEFYETDV